MADRYYIDMQCIILSVYARVFHLCINHGSCRVIFLLILFSKGRIIKIVRDVKPPFPMFYETDLSKTK